MDKTCIIFYEIRVESKYNKGKYDCCDCLKWIIYKKINNLFIYANSLYLINKMKQSQ